MKLENDEAKTDETKKEDPLDNEIQIHYIFIKDIFYVTLLMSLAIYMFIRFLPMEINNSSFLWITFKNYCCKNIFNETRCQLNTYCNNSLIKYMEIKNISTDFLPKCCYWFAEYSGKPLLYCNPKCLI